ncbi:MAG: hypothetical protein MJ108_05170 [Saccharofermentans sp.]|nr:hypothetical protein [Saccharofermentans sp.]
MTRYYRYRLIKSLPVLAVSLIAGFLFLNIGLINNYGGYYSSKRYYTVSMEPVYILFIIEAFAYAYLAFSSFRNKRNLDTWFSFPLSREKIAIVHVLDVLTMYAIQAVLFGLNGVVLIASHSGLNVLYFFPAVLISALYGFLMFLFCSCTFLFGNSVFDGAVSIFAWLNVPSAIVTAISYINVLITGDYQNMFRNEVSVSPYYGIAAINSYFEYYMNKNVITKIKHAFDYTSFYMEEYKEIPNAAWISIGIWSAIFIVAAVALPFVFSKRPTEKIGGVSDFVLCYEFLIPFYTVFMFIIAEDRVPLKLFFVIAAYIAYAIYRKSPNITAKRFVVIAVFAVLAFIPVFDLMGVEGVI